MRRRNFVRRKRGFGNRRRAGAIVEFAVVLPLLLTILFGIIEYGWVFMVRQTLQHAAREGCRRAVLQTSTEDQVTGVVAEILEAANIGGYTLTQTHEGAPNWVETVRVTVPYNSVSLVGGFFGTHNYDLVGACSMRKEGVTDES